MSWLFDSGHAVDIVLAVIAVEAIWLITRKRRFADFVFALLPGVLILLGLRAALTDAHWIWIALPLAASLPVHLADLRRRKLI